MANDGTHSVFCKIRKQMLSRVTLELRFDNNLSAYLFFPNVGKSFAESHNNIKVKKFLRRETQTIPLDTQNAVLTALPNIFGQNSKKKFVESSKRF